MPELWGMPELLGVPELWGMLERQWHSSQSRWASWLQAKGASCWASTLQAKERLQGDLVR
jgi:hypothetical protein